MENVYKVKADSIRRLSRNNSRSRQLSMGSSIKYVLALKNLHHNGEKICTSAAGAGMPVCADLNK